MRRIIPAPVISVCAEIVAKRETHATLEKLFLYAGAPGEPPAGNKVSRALEWLRNTNKDGSINPINVLGKLIENYMEELLGNEYDEERLKDREKITKILSQYELQYLRGGNITGSLGVASISLEEHIKKLDVSSIENEFNRALKNVEQNPREAVSAASNILESVCKVYITEENLEMPAKQDLKPIWSVVRKHMGFDPSAVEDKDLQLILSGLISITEGIGALRTHASSAHGAGKVSYKLEPRHARLAIHSAHTITLFIIESWLKRKNAF